MKYRKKPVVVEAVQCCGGDSPAYTGSERAPNWHDSAEYRRGWESRDSEVAKLRAQLAEADALVRAHPQARETLTVVYLARYPEPVK